MCSAATASVLEDIIIEKVNAGDMFTAFDVTLEAKAKGVQDRHRQIKHVVHDYFNSGNMFGYTRTLMDVGAPEQAFIYHPMTADPNTYQAKPRKQKRHDIIQNVVSGQIVPNVIAVTPPVQHGTAVLPSGVTARADGRGTVCIPAPVVKSAGFSPLLNVSVFAVNNEIMIIRDVNKAPVNFVRQRRYTVNCHGNIRISSRMCQAAGLPAGNKGYRYGVDHEPGKIVIRAAS